MADVKISIPQVNLASDFTAIVTGGHAGLGFEVSKYLALLGARVIIACDNETRARAAMLRIQADVMEMRGSVAELEKDDIDDDDTIGPSPSESASRIDAPLKVEFMRLDLASLDSVTHFAESFKEKGYPLQLLFCNDAVINVPKTQTIDGLELHFQYNYLAHMQLIILLLPSMHAHSGDTRIVLSSSKVHTQGAFDLKTIQGTGRNVYDSEKFFANSQLYLIMLMHSLDRRLRDTNVSVYAVHNGFIDTLLKKHADDLNKWSAIYTIGRQLDKICVNITKSVSNVLSVGLNPAFKSLKNSFFVKGIPLSTSQISKDVKAQEVLWRYSIDMIEEHLTQEEVKNLALSDGELEDLGIDVAKVPVKRR